MSLQRAARVGDPITHRSDIIGVTLGVVGAVIGAAAVILTAPVVVPASVIGVSLHVAGTGMIFGDWMRHHAPTGVRGHIVTGVPTVHVGAGSPRAANACPSTRVDCHDSWVAQGSGTVTFEGACASRVADKTACGGTIADGCPTVHIGGPQATVPGAMVDHDRSGRLFRIMSVVASLGSPGASLYGRLPGFLRADVSALRRADYLGVLAPTMEIAGVGLTEGGMPAFGRTMSSAGNTIGYGARLARLRATLQKNVADGVIDPRTASEVWEAAVRTPGTPARMIRAAGEF